MQFQRRELLVARLIAGCFRVKLLGRPFLIKQPGSLRRAAAEELYQESFNRAISQGLYSPEELTRFLQAEGLWGPDEELRLRQLTKQEEDFKVDLFQAALRSDERRKLREALQEVRSQSEDLLSRKSQYGYLSAEGHARLEKARYLAGHSLLRNGKPYYSRRKYWRDTSGLPDLALQEINRERPSEGELRELSRTEPWRSYWGGQKAGRLFSKPIVSLSFEQRALILWSSLYDNIREHPDCPSEDILDDDDMTDGWLILQRRKRGVAETQNTVDSMIHNEKIRNSQMLFVMAKTPEEAKKVEELNDRQSQAIKKMRDKKIAASQNVVHHHQFNDVANSIYMERNKRGG